jgi:uncharacterized membrane protein (DUF106 family)
MTTREKLQASGVNVNTIVAGVTLLGMIVTGVFFIAPLRSLPVQQEKMQDDVNSMKSTQAVQTEALKTLATIAVETKETRDKAIQHDTELREVKRRLDRLESR